MGTAARKRGGGWVSCVGRAIAVVAGQIASIGVVDARHFDRLLYTTQHPVQLGHRSRIDGTAVAD
jgi:hypothetical protein